MPMYSAPYTYIQKKMNWCLLLPIDICKATQLESIWCNHVSYATKNYAFWFRVLERVYPCLFPPPPPPPPPSCYLILEIETNCPPLRTRTTACVPLLFPIGHYSSSFPARCNTTTTKCPSHFPSTYSFLSPSPPSSLFSLPHFTMMRWRMLYHLHPLLLSPQCLFTTCFCPILPPNRPQTCYYPCLVYCTVCPFSPTPLSCIWINYFYHVFIISICIIGLIIFCAWIKNETKYMIHCYIGITRAIQ